MLFANEKHSNETNQEDYSWSFVDSPSDSQQIQELKQTIKSTLQQVDPFQVYFGNKVNYYGQQVDNWIGEDLDFEFTKSNRLELSLPLTYETHDNTLSLNLGFRSRFYFPKTNKKLHVVIDSNGEEFLGDERSATESNANQSNSPTSDQVIENVSVSLRGDFFSTPFFSISGDAGFEADSLKLDPVLGFRVRYAVPSYGKHSNYLLQKAYWQESVGQVLDHNYRHDWLLSDTLLFRYKAGLTNWFDEKYSEYYHSIAFYQSINAHRQYSYTLRGDWSTQPVDHGYGNESIGVGFTWRERLYQDWFYAVLTPFLNYRHDFDDEQYHIEPSITFSVEAHFFERAKN